MHFLAFRTFLECMKTKGMIEFAIETSIFLMEKKDECMESNQLCLCHRTKIGDVTSRQNESSEIK